ncbi:CG34451, partial [Drosophila busckii]
MVIYDYKQPVAAKYIKRTWGQHCNVLLFVAGQLDAELEPFVPLENCTDKSLLAREGLNYAYEYYKDDADWFLRIDDFSFVAMENLRYMLAKHKPKQALYMGYELREPLNKQAFNYWRCGYVLSWEALRRFQAESKYCGQRWEQRLKLSRCLRQAGVATASSTDELGYETFIPIASFELFL